MAALSLLRPGERATLHDSVTDHGPDPIAIPRTDANAAANTDANADANTHATADANTDATADAIADPVPDVNADRIASFWWGRPGAGSFP